MFAKEVSGLTGRGKKENKARLATTHLDLNPSDPWVYDEGWRDDQLHLRRKKIVSRLFSS